MKQITNQIKGIILKEKSIVTKSASRLYALIQQNMRITIHKIIDSEFLFYID